MTRVSRQELGPFHHLTTMCCLLLFLLVGGLTESEGGTQQSGRIVTEASVNVQLGKAGSLPCSFEITPIEVQWSKDSPAIENTIVYVETYYNPGQKGGVGYSDGTFDIADNFSLIIKEATLGDVGRYFCSILLDSDTTTLSNYTDLTVFVPPVHPYPTIVECYTSTTGRHTEQDCILDTRENSANITCTVNGYYPDFSLFFIHEYLDVEVLETREWNNTDGTYGSSLTIRAVPNSEPYTCIATGIVRSGDVDERSARIVLKRDILEPLAPERNRSKEIRIILALLLVSVIIPLCCFLIIARRSKQRLRFQKLQSTYTWHYQHGRSLSDEEEEECKRDLRYHYEECITKIKTSPLEPESMTDISDIYTNLFLMKDFVPKTVDEESINRRIPGFLSDIQSLGERDLKFKSKECMSHQDFLKLISPEGPPFRILLVGEAGVGKTTFLAKLVNDWIAGDELQNIQLMFHVPLSEAVRSESFGEAISMYLSDGNNCVPNIDEHIRMNQGRAMFLFDGLDEFNGDTTASYSDNSIVQIIRGERYRYSVVVLATRPWRADQILSNERLKKSFTCVSIEGFNRESTRYYVKTFFKDNPILAESLTRFLDEDSEEGGVFSSVMASYPIYLAMLCHIWREDAKQIKIRKLQSVSQLMEEMVSALKEHYASKEKHTVAEEEETNPEEEYQQCLLRVETCFEEIGRLAYHGCLSNQLIIDEQSRIIFKDSIETAYKVGVLTREKRIAPSHVRRTEKKKYVDECRFPHKLLQDYLAAVHLASLYDTDRATFNEQVQELLDRGGSSPDKFEYLWYFLVARTKDIARTTLEFLTRSTDSDFANLVIRVAFECQDKDVVAPFTSAILKSKALRLQDKKSFVAHLHVIDTSSTLDTLILNILPESKMWARNAAELIFSLENLRTLVIERCGKYQAEEFYGKMAEVSPSSKIENVLHRYDNLSPIASRDYARSLFSMPRLRNFNTYDVNLDNAFYETMEQLRNQANRSQIETMVIVDQKLQTSPAQSMHLANGLRTLTKLRTLFMIFGGIDNTFYHTMADDSFNLQIERLWFWMMGALSREASDNFMTWIFHRMTLKTLVLSVDELDVECFSKFAEMSSSAKIEKLWITCGGKERSDASCHLATGICSLPHLSSLYLEKPETALLNEMCVKMAMSRSSFQISTVILENAVVTRWNMETLLSLDSLRSVRFIRVEAKGEDRALASHGTPLTREDSERRSHVTELTMDDLSLSHLIELGVHEHCSRVEKVQLDFTSDVSNDVFAKLNGFLSASHLYLLGYRVPQHFSCKKKVAFTDASSLCRSLMTSWSRLASMVIVDIMIGNWEAMNILQMAGRHGSLRNLMITRCGTTDALDEKQGQTVDDVMIELTHGEPATTKNRDDETYADYLQRIDQAVFEDPFKVITVDHDL